MTTFNCIICVYSLTLSFIFFSCFNDSVLKNDNNVSNDSISLPQSDTAYGCEGIIYCPLDSNTFLVINYNSDALLLNTEYVFDLSKEDKLVKVYLDKYEGDGIIQSYCSDVIITNAMIPIKIPAKSGILKVKLFSEYADVALESVEFVDSDGKIMKIQDKRFTKVIMETGG